MIKEKTEHLCLLPFWKEKSNPKMLKEVVLFISIYTIYKENYNFQLFWAEFLFFQKCPQFLIQITHVTNR